MIERQSPAALGGERRGHDRAAPSQRITTVRRRLAPSVGPEGGAAPDHVERGIRAAQGGGRPMEPGVEQSMERAFGLDLSAVRIHTGAPAEGLTSAVEARAFTAGSDVFFGAGEYRPTSRSGQRVLAHELAHVAQQQGGRIRRRADPVVPALDISSSRVAGPADAYALQARTATGNVGSASVAARDESSIEVANLRVAPEHRQQGYGRELLSSAAEVGEQLGRHTVRLGSQDDGSGRLDAWYRGMGFSAVGADPHGHVEFAAPTRSILAATAAQRIGRDADSGRIRRMDAPTPASRYWRCATHGTWDAHFVTHNGYCPQCGELGSPATEAEVVKSASQKAEGTQDVTAAAKDAGPWVKLRLFCQADPARKPTKACGVRKVTIAQLLKLIDAYDITPPSGDIVADPNAPSGYRSGDKTIKMIMQALENLCLFCVNLLSSTDEDDIMDARMLRLSGIFNAILALLNDSCNNQNAKALRKKVEELRYSG